VSTDWLGALEGYYGPSLGHDARLQLMEWAGAKGYNCFAYAPKDDPFHREKWRDPYPDDEMRAFEELVKKGRDTGVEFCFTISPGLDWSVGDEEALINKLRSLAAIGCTTFGVLWDDVPPGGAELGESHARGTAAATDAIGGARWWTVCTDYAVTLPTPYLDGFCKVLPQEVAVSWTGSAVTPLTITGAEASSLGDSLGGRKLLLWENFPVNDALMKDVLHLGPYPERSPDLVDATQGAFINLMPQAFANRVGLSCAARFWTDQTSDRDAVWHDTLDEFPFLAPLARACRSWASDPGPDPELLAWAKAAPDDKRLRSYLEAGCRAGLDDALQAELEPWLAAWDLEAQVMLMCLDILERGYRSSARGIGGAMLWMNARKQEKQTFGIRRAVYPVNAQSGDFATTLPEAAVHGENLTDMLARRALRDE
jgi:hyaluronoglucosaminidase